MKLRAVNVPAGYKLTNGNIYDVAMVFKADGNGKDQLRAVAFSDDGYWVDYAPSLFEPV
jgi:hypothetical protein